MKKYDKYKDTNIEWLGEIPENWDLTKFRWLGDFNKNLVKDKVDNFKVLSLTIKGVIQRDLDSNYGKFPTSFSTYQLVKPDDIVICLFDMDVTPRIVGISDQEGIISPAYTIMSTKETVDANYIFYYLLEQDRNKSLLYNGTGLRRTLTRTRFANLPTIIPPLPEQTKISSYLDNKTSLIDKLINNNKKLIKLLEEKRTALINKVITKGLDPNVKMKDSGIEWIGEIPEHWDTSRIKRVAEIFGRIGFRGYTTQDIVPEGDGAITLSPSNIKSTRMLLDSCTYLSWEKYKESPEIMIFKNDIIFVKTGSTIGKVAMVETYPQEMTINPQLIVLKNLKVDAKYLYYNIVSTSFQYQVKREVRGGSTPAINQEKINNLTIVEAPLSEQTQISSYLDNKTSLIDKAIKEVKTENDLIKEYRQSLISNVVTGKVKVINL